MNPSGTFVVMAELDLNTGYAPDWFPDSVWTDPHDAYDRLEYLRTLPLVIDATMIPAPLDRLELARKQPVPDSRALRIRPVTPAAASGSPTPPSPWP